MPDRIDELEHTILILSDARAKLLAESYQSDATPGAFDALAELIDDCELEWAACQSELNAMDHAERRNEP